MAAPTAAAHAQDWSTALERVPGRRAGEMQVANIGAEPQSDTRADWHQHDVAGAERGHAKATHEISGAVDAGEALIHRLGRRQLVHEDHCAGAFAAPVESDRWALPEHAAVASVAGIERAFAIAQSGDERAAGFL